MIRPLANGSHAKLCGQGRVPKSCGVLLAAYTAGQRHASRVTPRRWGSAEGLQPRTEAGPHQLQREVSRRDRRFAACDNSCVERKYQIFISSTYEDLKDHRREVMEATLAMGHIPAGMELFSAADDEQWQIIAERIDECDYYIVIVAHRYGSVTATGLSYTQKEYRHAQQKGVPTLRFVVDDSVAWPPQFVETDPVRKKALDDFRSELLAKPVDFWRSPEDLGGKYSRALPKLIRSHPRSGWISGDSGVGPEVVSELTRLSHENSQLRAELDDLRRKSNVELDEIEATLNATTINGGYRKAGERSWEEAKATLLAVFDHIASALVVEADLQRVARLTFWAYAPDNVQPHTEWPVSKNHVEALLGILFSFGVVEPSTRKHSVKDAAIYWSLTESGKALLRARTMRIALAASGRRTDRDDRQSGAGGDLIP